jgi:hypothetical protein
MDKNFFLTIHHFSLILILAVVTACFEIAWTPVTATGTPAILREAARRLENVPTRANGKTWFLRKFTDEFLS